MRVLVWNLYQMFVTVSIEFWLRFEPQICPTRLAISFLFITGLKGRFVRVWNCLIFFRGWILIRLKWNLTHFVLNSVEILTWNFRKKLFRENFSEIFAQTRAIQYRNLWNFSLLSAIFILRLYSVEKMHVPDREWTKPVFRKQNVLDFLPRIFFLWFVYGRASLPGCKHHMKVLVWIFSALYGRKIKIAESRAKFHKFR